MRKLLLTLFFSLLLIQPAFSETASEVPLTNPEILEPPSRQQEVTPGPQDDTTAKAMTAARLGQIVKTLDENAVVQPRAMLLTIADVKISVILDPVSNRMRAFSAFQTLDGVDGQNLYRMMQANFDAALDARYAIAKGHLISVFIHPLAELQKDQFIEGLGQVVNLVKTYGTAYTSGAMTFGGGDSNEIHRGLIEELLKKGERI